MAHAVPLGLSCWPLILDGVHIMTAGEATACVGMLLLLTPLLLLMLLIIVIIIIM